MVRALWLFVVISVVTLAALWVADQQGEVAVTLPNAEVKTSLGVALMLLALAIVAAIFLYRLFHWAGMLPQALALWGDRRRRRKGYLALTRGLVAAAAGDQDDAKRQTRRAISLVGEPPLALLLAAQSAQLEGDEASSEKYFTAMLQSPEMEFLGLRGLYMAAIRKGEHDRALELAGRAFQLRPKAPWVVNALFELQSQKLKWSEASQTLDSAQKAKLIDSGVARRRRAVLFAARAREAEDQGDGTAALSLAQDALAIAPGLTAAAVIAAKYLSAQGRQWKASGILEAAWAKEPHPEIARAYALLKPDETPRNRSWRLSGLAAQKLDHPESRILAASIALTTGDWAGAREALRGLAQAFPTARICTLMADIERRAGDDAAARQWAARALKAPRDAVWACASCARQYQDWSAICPGCHAFDTLHWLSGATDKVTKMPAEQVLSGIEADTGDLAVALYRDAVKIDEEAVSKAAKRESPQPAVVVRRDMGGTGALKDTGDQVIVMPAPDDPGPDVDDPFAEERESARKRGAGW